jgi:type VII secretion protein EssA
MRTNKIIILLSILLTTLFVGGVTALAETEGSPVKLAPLEYEKLKFEKNTDYLHDDRKTEMKNTIPTKQFDIYFDGRMQLPDRDDTSFLFQTSARGEKSTVEVKTSELQLFSLEKKRENEATPVTIVEEESSDNMTLTLILIGVLAVSIILVFTLFLPKLVNTSEVSRTKTSIG